MFLSEPITESNIAEYKEYLPASYVEPICYGEFSAAAVYDHVLVGDKEEKALFGLYITAVHVEWLEFVWFDVIDSAVETVEKGLFLSYILNREMQRRPEELKGAFVELHPEEAWEDVQEALALAGMEAHETENNYFEFALSQVRKRDQLEKTGGGFACIGLGQASQEQKDALDELMQNDERPIPVPVYIEWEEYHQEISCICLKKGIPCGAVLISRQGSYLLFELAYSTVPTALPVVFGYALREALRICGEEQRILVPVVVNKTDSLMEYFVPGIKRETILVGIMRSPQPSDPQPRGKPDGF